MMTRAGDFRKRR